jgi:hypothetical protein
VKRTKLDHHARSPGASSADRPPAVLPPVGVRGMRGVRAGCRSVEVDAGWSRVCEWGSGDAARAAPCLVLYVGRRNRGGGRRSGGWLRRQVDRSWHLVVTERVLRPEQRRQHVLGAILRAGSRALDSRYPDRIGWHRSDDVR